MPSGTTDQPMTSDENLKCAIDRVEHCQSTAEVSTADLFIGIEKGVDNFTCSLATLDYVVISDKHHRIFARSVLLLLSPVVYKVLSEGEELGDVMGSLFNTKNIKHKGGAIGLLTRESIYTQALILTMEPLLNN